MIVAQAYLADLAREDLTGIWEYLAQHNEQTADRITANLLEQCAKLAEHPLMGRAREELVRNMRSFPLGKYLIFYRPRDEGIEVLRIVHGSRDIDTLFT
jgi:toxin ParE1/3/4